MSNINLDALNLNIIRKSINEFIVDTSKKYFFDGCSVLEIGPSDTFQNMTHLVSSNFSYHSFDISHNVKADIIGDICTTNNQIEDNFFDFIYCCEVLEHTKKPWLAVKELYRILKPGGKVFITVPIDLYIHPPFPDCWRILPDGMRVLLKEEAKFSDVLLEKVPHYARGDMLVHLKAVATK